MTKRRRDKRFWFIGAGIFVAVFLFTFLASRFKTEEEVDAANLANFKAGYIISDYQMTNYTSMTEAQIQAFLTSKNSCSETSYSYYQSLSSKNSLTWHYKDGHFVCLSEELFGDGETIGTGETAAHIIYQAAQDYKINPQVLIVLLQKETGLITDPIPNNADYRKATGYGCPDNGAGCSSEYYGFKNQVRRAAELFSTVMNGGWTNYPLGDNYVKYNPNVECGGTTVNIQNLATSALYRYTPYQPNAAALAAGYGTGDACSSYGNRNFYLYFEDWFGGITNESKWIKMSEPRVMETTSATSFINPGVENSVEQVASGYRYYFTSKAEYKVNGVTYVCLRTLYDTNHDNDKCILMNNLQNYGGKIYGSEEKVSVTYILKNNSYKYNFTTGEKIESIAKSSHGEISFSSKVTYNGKTYYRTTFDYNNNREYFIPEDDLIASNVEKISVTYLLKNDTYKYDLTTGEKIEGIAKSSHGEISFSSKVTYNGKTYYRTTFDYNRGKFYFIPAEDLQI